MTCFSLASDNQYIFNHHFILRNIYSMVTFHLIPFKSFTEKSNKVYACYWGGGGGGIA